MIPRYLTRANALLVARGQQPVLAADIRGADDQLRLLVDVLHVYGIAVMFDVVYNHAGGDFGDESLYFFDRVAYGNNNDSLYFTDQGWTGRGGLVFAYWNASVRQFLIDNAVSLVTEFHVDGLRYDEVSVIDRYGGWRFCQDLTGTMRSANPAAVQIAEFWNAGLDAAVWPSSAGGAGFDLVWHAGLRDAVRSIIEQSAHGANAFVNLEGVRDALAPPAGFDCGWRCVQMLENHDVLLTAHAPQDRKPRGGRAVLVRSKSLARCGQAPPHRSRHPDAVHGTGVLGGQTLERLSGRPDHLWDGLKRDRSMSDHLRFTRELISVRRRLGALRRGRINVFHCHNPTRVLAFHRWIQEREAMRVHASSW